MNEERKPRVLVVDDEPDMVALLQDVLTQAGFDSDGVPSGARMREAVARCDYALILLDLRLKSEDGLTLARELRERSAIPIIGISGCSDITDRVLLLELAADDFLIKPFNPRELIARVRAVLRRVSDTAPADRRTPSGGGSRDRLHFGHWVLDLAERDLIGPDGGRCALTQAEFRLLETFVSQPRRVWTRDQLLEHTRGLETEVFDRTIDVLILRLRRKIESNPKHPEFICTERGIGYVFAADVRRA